MSGLLPVLDVHAHPRVVLADPERLGLRAVDAALAQRQSLLLAHGHVVALEHADGVEQPDQRLHDLLLKARHAQRDDLEGQTAVEFVHRQAGKPVRLAEHDAAGVLKAQQPPVLPRRLDAPPQKRAVDRLIDVARQHPHGDFGAAVEKAQPHRPLTAVEHLAWVMLV